MNLSSDVQIFINRHAISDTAGRRMIKVSDVYEIINMVTGAIPIKTEIAEAKLLDLQTDREVKSLETKSVFKIERPHPSTIEHYKSKMPKAIIKLLPGDLQEVFLPTRKKKREWAVPPQTDGKVDWSWGDFAHILTGQPMNVPIFMGNIGLDILEKKNMRKMAAYVCIMKSRGYLVDCGRMEVKIIKAIPSGLRSS